MSRREIDAWVALQLTYGGRLVQSAWVLILLGMAGFWLWVLDADTSGLLFLTAEPDRVEATVVSEPAASRSEVLDAHGLVLVRFRYPQPGGREGEGWSLVEGVAPERGAKVTVEYLPARPEVVRLVGGRQDLYPPSRALVALVPLAGGLMLVFGLRRNRRRLRVLTTSEDPSAAGPLPDGVEVSEARVAGRGRAAALPVLALPAVTLLVHGVWFAVELFRGGLQ